MISDRIGREKTYSIAYLMMNLGIAFLLAATLTRSLPVLYGYSFFFGLGYGAIATLNMAMAADQYAGNRFGVIYGLFFLGTSLGSAIGPFIWGMIFDRFSSYTLAILTPPVTFLVSWMALKRIYRHSPPSRHQK
jgi:MFS family permease